MSLFNSLLDTIDSNSERISWEQYFMSIAHLTSIRSPCTRLHVGCVLVKDKRIISSGYNGFLPNAPHNSIVVDDHEVATVHAEQNTISDSAKRGVNVNGATAYITHYPCIHCAKLLAASGISEIYYHSDYKNNPVVSEILMPLCIPIKKI